MSELHLLDYARVDRSASDANRRVMSPGYWSLCGEREGTAANFLHTARSASSSYSLCPLCLEAIALVTGKRMIYVSRNMFHDFKTFILERNGLDDNYQEKKDGVEIRASES